MLKQPEKPSTTPHAPELAPSGDLPQRLLYATSAHLGASGLGTTSIESVKASHENDFLARAVTYGNRQDIIPADKIRSLRTNPIRLLSFVNRNHYTPMKKRAMDAAAAAELRSGRYDCFHGWASESLQSLEAARENNIPSLLEIATWHRNKGKIKPNETKSERERRNAPRFQRMINSIPISRQEVLREYDLADVILVASEKARETFTSVGIPTDKVHYVGRGVNVDRFTPGMQPDKFRLIFVGSLIKRKGVHLILQAWKRLNLKDAELVIIGDMQDEMKPFVEEFATDSVSFPGFTSNVADELTKSSAFVFPTECEGWAKSTLEACACGLPLITTRESGDALIDGVNGRLIPPQDLDALTAAIEEFHSHPEKLAAMGMAGRERIAANFTWDHFRARLLDGYRLACRQHQK